MLATESDPACIATVTDVTAAISLFRARGKHTLSAQSCLSWRGRALLDYASLRKNDCRPKLRLGRPVHNFLLRRLCFF